jgi:hypothetical protein
LTTTSCCRRLREAEACEMGEEGRPQATTNKWRGPKMQRNNQQMEGRNKRHQRQRRWLRGGGRQMGNMTTDDRVGGDGAVAIKRRVAD